MKEIIEAYEQIDQYAARHPARWRQHINDCWMRGRHIDGFPLIYGLRNLPGHGPRWLANYQPKKGS